MLYSLECQQKGHSVVTSLLSLFYRQNKQQEQQLLAIYRTATYSWWKKHDNLTISQQNRWKYNFQPSHWATDNHKGLQNRFPYLCTLNHKQFCAYPLTHIITLFAWAKPDIIHKQMLIYIHDCFVYKKQYFQKQKSKKLIQQLRRHPDSVDSLLWGSLSKQIWGCITPFT